MRLEPVFGLVLGHGFDVAREADDVGAVGMGRVGHREEVVQEAALGLALAHAPLFHDDVLLLVELPQHGVGEAVPFEGSPQLQLVGREGVMVDGLVEGGEGVEARAAFAVYDLRELVGDDVLLGLVLGLLEGRLQLLDLRLVGLGMPEPLGAEGQESIVFLLDGGFLVGVVRRTDGRCALEGHVLEDVSEARASDLLVHAAHVGVGHHGRDRRLRPGQKDDGQAVGQGFFNDRALQVLEPLRPARRGR